MLCPIHKLVKGCLQPALSNRLIDIICKGMPEKGIRTDIDFVSVLTKGQLSQSQNMVLLNQEARRLRSELGATLCSRRAVNLVNHLQELKTIGAVCLKRTQLRRRSDNGTYSR